MPVTGGGNGYNSGLPDPYYRPLNGKERDDASGAAPILFSLACDRAGAFGFFIFTQ
jgi:hypothetical protein